MHRFKHLAWIAAAVTFFVGVTVLAGWLFQLPRMTTVFTTVAMKPNTAVGLLLAAASLALLTGEKKRFHAGAGQVLAAFALALGLLTAMEYLFHFNVAMDDWIVAVPDGEALDSGPSLMSPITAFCFVGLGLGLFLLNGRKRGAILLSEVATVSVLLAAMLGLAGYTYGVSAFYRIGPYSSLAIPTAFAFLLLGVGILAARPERGLVSLLTRQTSGSIMARRLLLAAVFLPMILGWLRVRGEHAGYFDLAFGTALLITLLITIFIALIWWTAVSLDREDLARQESDAMLRESKAILDFTLQSAQVGDWDLDLVNDTSRRSLRHDQCFGYSEPVPSWGFETLIEHVHPEDRAEIERRFRAAVHEQKDWRSECRVIWPDGGTHWIGVHGSIYRTPAGQATRMLGIVFDITNRKQSEESLRTSEQQARALSQSLEQRVAERTSELEGQARSLRHLATELVSAEQRERKHLAALLHDDLQQLLVAASMDLNVVRKRAREESDIQALEHAAHWVGEATRAARDLTSQLRPPALYEEGFVAALHWLASRTRELHRVEIIIHGSKPATRISDEFNAMLFDCVRELLLNIVKHAGVNKATVSVHEEDNGLEVSVRDEGRGFDFEAVSRGQSSTGFGLFSIRERLLALGGVMSIESAPGTGTHVRLEVPLAIAALNGSASEPVVPDLSGEFPGKEAFGEPTEPLTLAPQRVRALVVDDHALVRQGLATMINDDERMTVVAEAADGIAAIAAVEKHQPDVILIDVNMPRMNGIEATREICRRWPGSIVIGLSVQDDPTTANLMRTAGAKAFLSKGGSADEMIETIMALQGVNA